MRVGWAPLLLVAALAGCGSSDTSAREEAATNTVHHRGLYYLGDSFEGLPLTHAESTRDRRGLFVYGSCEPTGSEGGCAPPLQLQNFPLGTRHPSMFELMSGQPAACRRTRVDGVPAAMFATSGGALEVYAGETVVVIWSHPSQTSRAAFALRPYGQGRERTRRGLPQPPASVSRELERCGTDSVATKLQELRRSASIPIYWVGRRYAGYPLARVEGAGGRARFVYGDCARRADYYAEGGCWAPLELVVERLDVDGPSRYAPAIECRRTYARGAAIAVLPGAHTVQIFVGKTAVTMYAREIPLMIDAARSLRLLEERHTTGPLPAPPAPLVSALERRCAPS